MLPHPPYFFPSASAPLPLCPHSNLSALYSHAAHHAGPSVESRKLEFWARCLQARTGGYEMSACGRGWPLAWVWARVTLTAMFKRSGEKNLKNLSAWWRFVGSGAQWMSIITHIVLTGPFMWGIIRQNLHPEHREPGKVWLASWGFFFF